MKTCSSRNLAQLAGIDPRLHFQNGFADDARLAKELDLLSLLALRQITGHLGKGDEVSILIVHPREHHVPLSGDQGGIAFLR